VAAGEKSRTSRGECERNRRDDLKSAACAARGTAGICTHLRSRFSLPGFGGDRECMSADYEIKANGKHRGIFRKADQPRIFDPVQACGRFFLQPIRLAQWSVGRELDLGIAACRLVQT
jgi:hypothetical protein